MATRPVKHLHQFSMKVVLWRTPTRMSKVMPMMTSVSCWKIVFTFSFTLFAADGAIESSGSCVRTTAVWCTEYTQPTSAGFVAQHLFETHTTDLSPIRLLSVTFVRPTQAVQIFGNISTALGTLAIH